MGNGISRFRGSPLTPSQNIERNLRNAHSAALDKINIGYNEIMNDSSNSEYDKAIKVQELENRYDPSIEFSNIMKVNGLDAKTICDKNSKKLHAQQDKIKKSLNVTIADKTAMLINLQHDIQSNVDQMKSNKVSIDYLNDFKSSVISSYAGSLKSMIKQQASEQALVDKINKKYLTDLTIDWDSQFKLADDTIADYIENMSRLYSDIASMILVNEMNMKTMKIDYNSEIVDTHVKNYRKLFNMISHENTAFDTYKERVDDLYASDEKRNEYDNVPVTNIKVVNKWMFRIYVITFIVFMITLFRYNTSLSRNVKIAIVLASALYPFTIHYVELYAYYVCVYFRNRIYTFTGDLQFEPK